MGLFASTTHTPIEQEYSLSHQHKDTKFAAEQAGPRIVKLKCYLRDRGAHMMSRISFCMTWRMRSLCTA
jgi:hypothetical protein